MAAKRTGSRSHAQSASEKVAIRQFAEENAIQLEAREIVIDNCKVNVDGYHESPDGSRVVLAETWAHIGKAIGSQPKKVLTDVLKMVFIAEEIRRTRPGCDIKMYMIFIDKTAAKTLASDCWGGAAAKRFGVVPYVVSIDRSLIDAVAKAQVAQNLLSEVL